MQGKANIGSHSENNLKARLLSPTEKVWVPERIQDFRTTQNWESVAPGWVQWPFLTLLVSEALSKPNSVSCLFIQPSYIFTHRQDSHWKSWTPTLMITMRTEGLQERTYSSKEYIIWILSSLFNIFVQAEQDPLREPEALVQVRQEHESEAVWGETLLKVSEALSNGRKWVWDEAGRKVSLLLSSPAAFQGEHFLQVPTFCLNPFFIRLGVAPKFQSFKAESMLWNMPWMRHSCYVKHPLPSQIARIKERMESLSHFFLRKSRKA